MAELLLLEKLLRAIYTCDCLCSSSQFTWTGWKEGQQVPTHPQLWSVGPLWNLFSTETTDPYSLISNEVYRLPHPMQLSQRPPWPLEVSRPLCLHARVNRLVPPCTLPVPITNSPRGHPPLSLPTQPQSPWEELHRAREQHAYICLSNPWPLSSINLIYPHSATWGLHCGTFSLWNH